MSVPFFSIRHVYIYIYIYIYIYLDSSSSLCTYVHKFHKEFRKLFIYSFYFLVTFSCDLNGNLMQSGLHLIVNKDSHLMKYWLSKFNIESFCYIYSLIIQNKIQ